jgi:hypothetical protein
MIRLGYSIDYGGETGIGHVVHETMDEISFFDRQYFKVVPVVQVTLDESDKTPSKIQRILASAKAQCGRERPTETREDLLPIPGESDTRRKALVDAFHFDPDAPEEELRDA